MPESTHDTPQPPRLVLTRHSWEYWAIRLACVGAILLALWGALVMVALFLPGPNQAKATLALLLAARSSARAASPADASVIDPRRLASDPERFRGQNIVVQGKALNVEQRGDSTWINLQAVVPERPEMTESVAVETRQKNPDILRDECYRVYGLGAGTQTAQRSLTGATVTVPLVASYQQERAIPGSTRGACAPP